MPWNWCEKLQRPLRWTAHHHSFALSEEGTVATGDNWTSAVCGGHEMRRGRHYATFTIRTLGDAMRDVLGQLLGVVGPGFRPNSGASAYGSLQGWMLSTRLGVLFQASNGSNWEGQPGMNELKQGDVVVRCPSAPCLRRRAVSHCRCRRACCSTATRQP